MLNTLLRRLLPVVISAGLIGVGTPALAAKYTPVEEANQKVVLDFYAALNQADATHSMKRSARAIVEKYIGVDYIQHSAASAHVPGPGGPRDKLIQMFESAPDQPGVPVMPKTLAVMADGDRVILLTTRDIPGAGTTYIFNMFRVKAGKLVEHWDSSAPPMAAAPGGQPH